MSNIIGNQIKLIRTEHKLSQAAFGKEVSEFMNKKRNYGIPVVSAWETGRRIPPAKTLSAISALYGVDLQALLEGESANSNSSDLIADIPNNRISYGELKEYHGKPIFLVFNNLEHKDQWGIVDSRRNVIKTLDYEFSFDELISDVLFYRVQPYGSVELEHRYDRGLSIAQVQNLKRVWVCVRTFDDYIRGRYDGWWYNNTSKTALINVRGDILPYESLGYSYNAYKAPFQFDKL